MICQDPYVKAGTAFPCGKCLPCLVRRKKLWTHRLMLESLCHGDNAFVTLTYSDEMLPASGGLIPNHLSEFVRALRDRIAYEEQGDRTKRKFRYYGVGEYGDLSERPHYHLLLFGYPTCLRGRSSYSERRLNCCSQCDRVRDAWGKGHVGLGSVTTESVGYTVSYIVKNMRRTDDHRLNGRWPEFARMSLKPGLGFDALWEIADVLLKYDKEDTPSELGHGRGKKPLGRYLRQKLAEMCGKEKAGVMDDEEMLALWNAAKVAAPSGGEVRKTIFKNMLLDAAEQRVLNMAARLKIAKAERIL